MIQTSIGSIQVGSPWLARQWINSIPGISVTAGITQNNLTIRAGNSRPSVTTTQSTVTAAAGKSGGGGSSGGGGGFGGDDGGDNLYTYF